MIARFLVLLIRAYQRFVSPLLGPVCRFAPSCSHYTLVCIERFGALRGLKLGVHRIARCHPFHPGGVDLPPEVPGHPVGIAMPAEVQSVDVETPPDVSCEAPAKAASSPAHAAATLPVRGFEQSP